MLTLSNRLGLALAISFVAVACAAPTIPNQTADQGDGTSDPSESASSKKAAPKKPSTTKPTTPGEGDAPPGGSTTPPANPTPTTTPPAGGNCAASATGQACSQCCDQASGGSLGKAEDAYFACACDQGGQCATICAATMCRDQQPSAACDSCLQQKCEPAADALCTSAACKAGQQCLQTDCAGKQ